MENTTRKENGLDRKTDQQEADKFANERYHKEYIVDPQEYTSVSQGQCVD
jgi:hypothetical protein